MKILIADDNDINRQFLNAVLEPEPCEVVQAADGLEALSLCREHRFDLIFMDIRMPEIDGMQATSEIRALQGYAAGQCRIVALTADLRVRQVEDLLNQGFDACMTKPVDRATVLSEVRQQSADSIPDPVNPPTETGEPWIDWDSALSAAGGNRELVQRLADMLVKELEQFLPAVNACIASAEHDRARDMVHKVRGSAGYCGARPLQRRAEDLEAALSAGESCENELAAFRAAAEATSEAFRNEG